MTPVTDVAGRMRTRLFVGHGVAYRSQAGLPGHEHGTQLTPPYDPFLFARHAEERARSGAAMMTTTFAHPGVYE